jgi:hypothetical protein
MQQVIHFTFSTTDDANGRQLTYRGCSYRQVADDRPVHHRLTKVGQYRGVRYEMALSQVSGSHLRRVAKYRGHAYLA